MTEQEFFEAERLSEQIMQSSFSSESDNYETAGLDQPAKKTTRKRKTTGSTRTARKRKTTSKSQSASVSEDINSECEVASHVVTGGVAHQEASQAESIDNKQVAPSDNATKSRKKAPSNTKKSRSKKKNADTETSKTVEEESVSVRQNDVTETPIVDLEDAFAALSKETKKSDIAVVDNVGDNDIDWSQLKDKANHMQLERETVKHTELSMSEQNIFSGHDEKESVEKEDTVSVNNNTKDLELQLDRLCNEVDDERFNALESVFEVVDADKVVHEDSFLSSEKKENGCESTNHAVFELNETVEIIPDSVICKNENLKAENKNTSGLVEDFAQTELHDAVEDKSIERNNNEEGRVVEETSTKKDNKNSAEDQDSDSKQLVMNESTDEDKQQICSVNELSVNKDYDNKKSPHAAPMYFDPPEFVFDAKLLRTEEGKEELVRSYVFSQGYSFLRAHRLVNNITKYDDILREFLEQIAKEPNEKRIYKVYENGISAKTLMEEEDLSVLGAYNHLVYLRDRANN